MPVVFLSVGETKAISYISGSAQLRQRMQDLGFLPGYPITLIGKLDGNLILQVRDSRIALGQEIARHIHV